MTKTEFISKRKIVGTLCQAPHTNLYLGHKGIASVCCANRSYIIGEYPKDSLKDIWNSEKLKELRKELDNFSFKKGCFQCSYFLEMEKFKLLKITHYDIPDNNYRNLEYPYRLDLELNNTCNLECKMCNGVFSSSIRKNREKRDPYISPYENDEFLIQLKPFLLNAKQINLYGGEPFLIKIYDKIFDILLEQKSKISKNKKLPSIFVQTNGTVFSQKTEKIVTELDINLGVSVDGGTQAVYENIRKNSSFTKVVENCKAFKHILKKKNKNFFISTVLCKENIHDLLNIVILANKFECDIYFQHVVHPVSLSIENMDLNELKNIVNFYNDSLESIAGKFLPKNNNYYSLIDAINFVKTAYKNKFENKKQYYTEAGNVLADTNFSDEVLTLDILKQYDLEKYKILENVSIENKIDIKYLEDFLSLFRIRDAQKTIVSNEEFKINLNKYLKHIL